jgi:hypothetical protein
MSSIDFSGINAAALARAPGILFEWIPGGHREGKEYRAATIKGGPGKSFSVSIETGKWADFATGESGSDLISLYAQINNLTQGEAARKLAEQFGISCTNGTGASAAKRGKKADWEIVWPIPPESLGKSDEPRNPPAPPKPLQGQVEDGGDIYPYRNAEGRVLMYAVRLKRLDNGDKEPRLLSLWKHKISSGTRWQWFWPPGPRPLYNLDRLTANPDLPVLIVAGEKCADAGTGSVSSWITTTFSGGESHEMGPAEGTPDSEGGVAR